MTEEKLYELAYNAHEGAEAAAMTAMRDSLEAASIDALACLCDPSWNWTTRSWMSDSIIDQASDLLDEKLDEKLWQRRKKRSTKAVHRFALESYSAVCPSDHRIDALAVKPHLVERLDFEV